MFMVFAVFPMLTFLWGYLNPRVRNIEDELPDADTVGEEEPAVDAAAADETGR